MSDLPLNSQDLSLIDVTTMKDSMLGSIKSSKARNIVFRELPPVDDFLFVDYYNLQHNSILLIASHRNVFIDNDNSKFYNVYLNNELLGEYKCFSDYDPVTDNYPHGEKIPTINDLTPNTTYTAKVEYVYSNRPHNPIYEPNFNLNTNVSRYKEFQFISYTEPITPNELVVDVVNITNNSFELDWRTDLSNLMNCYELPIDYTFELKINGELHKTFQASGVVENTQPIRINGLVPNTLYSVELICKVTKHVPFGNPPEITYRKSEFEVNTLQ